MANALESASLVMIPSGYEDGTLGSLKPTDGTGDFTFSRGSDISATRVNADGYIEKGYENLLLQSNSFTTTWIKSNASLTSGQSGHDGANNAWLIERTGTFGQIIQNITNSGVQTFSVYAKADSLNWIRLTQGSSNAYFDLSGSGAVGQVTQCINATIESIGGGWFKCSITSNVSLNQVRVYLANGNSDLSGTTGSIYIQDAMLNQGLVAYPYKETTTAPVAGGILEDMPRLDYSNGSCPSLKLEPQRTNLVEYSEYFGSYYTINSVLNKTDNAANSPEGVQNATLISENTYSSTIPIISTGNRYSLSGYQTATLYVKAENNVRYFGISFGSNAQRLRTTFDFENNTFNTILYNGDVANGSLSYEELQNGWYRIIVTANFVTSATGASYQFAFLQDNTYLFFAFQSSDNRQFYIYGLQVEQDATYETSYIPTYGVSQTRLRDAQAELTIPNGSTTEGTIFYEFDKAQASASFDIVPLKVGTNRILRISQYNPNMRFSINENATSYDESNSYNSHIKVAVSYSSSSVKLFINGFLRATDTTYSASGNVIIPANGLQATNIGCSLESKQLTYFPTALTDSECIELTTI